MENTKKGTQWYNDMRRKRLTEILFTRCSSAKTGPTKLTDPSHNGVKKKKLLLLTMRH